MSDAAVRLRAGCKINLYLEIVSLREDGYHELRTLFYPLPEPFDTLDVSAGTRGQGLRLTCSRPELEGEGNLVCKTYAAFARQTGYAPDINVHLEKNIPDGAGLGGGSSDAAALLRWLNEQATEQTIEHGAPLEPDALNALAASLGADVPFFLSATPAWAEGIGEKLAPASVDLSDFTVVLACPDIKVPTGWAYGQWDARFSAQADSLPGPERNCDKMKSPSFLTTTPGEDMCPSLRGPRLFNSFENAVFPHHPPLRIIKEKLLAQGAAGALMSGSGSSVFALFRDEGQAGEAITSLGGDLQEMDVRTNFWTTGPGQA